jgi:hypothetical protein
MKKLNHPPFNDWLLSEDLLTPAQTRQLQEHLSSCQECNKAKLALVEVKHLFHAAGQVVPVEGFTVRWQKRLAIQLQKRQRRNAWLFFGVAASMAVFILTFLLFRVYSVLDSPATFLASLVYLWTFSQLALAYLSDIIRVVFRFIPSISLLGLVFFTGFCSLVSVLWFVTVRKLTSNGRVVSW